MVRILVIEDDDHYFPDMKECLEERAAALGITTELLQAKKALKDFEPDIISVDMMFPLRNGGFGEMEIHAGAHFVSYMLRYKKTPYLMYSGNEEDEVLKIMKDEGVEDRPLILHKDHSTSHKKWAEALLSLSSKAP
jgi:CheY-like chemotaxis protein